MVLRLTFAAFLIQVASIAGASPTVSDYTITWPDNGWYQVQQLTDSGLVNVCEGGRSCVVTPGEYVVINLSSGERFEGIHVAGESTTLPSRITVSGDVISWPDNGWYQVQAATTYASMCEGGVSCRVPGGTYSVINHTTGERWDNVSVDEQVASETEVSFDITVPAYVSNALQVKLQWGDIHTTASWINDESWSVTESLPINTENDLTVTFSDDNGAIILGRFETGFATGNSHAESLSITENQFDTQRWDTDRDGFSNLDELLAGTNPLQFNTPIPVEASLEIMRDKTFRISWHATENNHSYRVFENIDGVSGYTDISGELSSTTTSFDHRVALYLSANAQYLVQTCNWMGCTESALVSVTGTLESAVGFFKASDTAAEAEFGASVSLSADGGTMVVGAPGANGGGGGGYGTGQGAVYVFARVIGGWEQRAYLRASNVGNTDRFGHSVSISADGTTIAVGAVNESSAATGVNGDQTDNSEELSGAVYVFTLRREVWLQHSYLKASNAEEFDRFGWDVSLSANGKVLAVGAPNEDSAATGINGRQNNNDAIFSGAVYLFERSAGFWQQQTYVKASEVEFGDAFGRAVSLSADGNKLAVGATGEDSAADGLFGDQSDNSAESAGAVYVFVRSGIFWNQNAYVKGSNSEAFDLFGWDVSLSADGSTLVIGISGDDSAATGVYGNSADNSARSSGAVSVFVSRGSFWQRQAYIKSSNTAILDGFGTSISVSADGNTLAVGAVSEASAAIGVNGDQTDNSAVGSGATYLFMRNAGVWQQQAYVKANNTGRDSAFGHVVGLSSDGDTLAVGAPGEESATTGINGDQSVNSVEDAGAVYIY